MYRKDKRIDRNIYNQIAREWKVSNIIRRGIHATIKNKNKKSNPSPVECVFDDWWSVELKKYLQLSDLFLCVTF